jgi:SNF2 family DNA or RNA helicase
MTILRKGKPANLEPKHRGFKYQVEAVEAIRELPFAGVFHEQGLGKTKIGLDLALLWLHQELVDSVLIVTKKSLVKNWRDEIAAHTHLKPRILDQDHQANYLAFNSPARVYLAHYEVLKSENARLKLFLKTRRVGVILDESQKIKNPDADVTVAARSLSAGFSRRVIMTGTPIANRPYDIWSQIAFLDEGKALGEDFNEFKESLDLTNDLADAPDKVALLEEKLGILYEQIRPFCIRETKASSGIVLPEKRIENVYVELAPRQAEIYRQYKEELGAIVVKSGRAIQDDADGILKRLLRLVQVASNPRLVDSNYAEEPGKLSQLRVILDMVGDNDEKAIVWTSFIDNATWLAKEFDRMNAAVVHGGRSIDERNAAIAEFKNDRKCRILIATPGAAKEGLTLTVANHAIFYDRSFSLDDYLQAQDRIHRISQTKACLVQNLIARDTIDEWVDALLAAKHLAAQLGQGDLSKAEYRDRASYDFGEMVREILGLDESEVGDD